MPNYDGTGPQGQGAMSGGGFGRCAAGRTDVAPGQGRARGGFGRGQDGSGRGGFCGRLGRGLGRAFGFGRFSGAAAGSAQDPAQARIEALEREIAALKEQLRSR